jgi:hypothetical protein
MRRIDFIAHTNIFSHGSKIVYGHNLHLTPYQPTIKALNSHYHMCGQKGYGDFL